MVKPRPPKISSRFYNRVMQSKEPENRGRIGGQRKLQREGLEDREKDWKIWKRFGGEGEGLEDREKVWKIWKRFGG